MAQTTNANSHLRRANREAVLGLIARRGPMSRSEICAATGLTGAGLSRIARELIELGLVSEQADEERKGLVGRQGARLEIDPTGAFVLGVTLTANRVSIALYDAGRRELGLSELNQPDLDKPESVLRTLIAAGTRLIDDAGIPVSRLVGVGVAVGVPTGNARLADGLVSSRVLGWHDVPVAARFQSALGLPVCIEPRSIALLRAEIELAQAPDHRRIFLINCGVEVGCAGVFQDQLLWQGQGGLGNLDHIAVPGSDVECDCGRSGCLAQISSGVGVVRAFGNWPISRGRRLAELAPHLNTIIETAAAGDRRARAALQLAGRHMAHGVDVVMALLAPDEIILAGQVGRQEDFVAGVRCQLAKIGIADVARRLRVSTATSAQAAAGVALDAFAFSKRLNVQRLKAA